MIDLLYNVGVFESFEQTDFSNGSRRDSIVFFLQSDFLERHILIRLQVFALPHDTICTFSELLLALIAFKL